jgi:tRNA(fMet)-specific endonuclease VapC
MKRYLLDTNTVSHLLKEHPGVARRLVATPIAALCISAITEGELRFGLAKRPEAKRLHLAVKEFLRRVDVLPWDSGIAERYGPMRAEMERQGKVLGSLDGLIAAHALAVGAVVVSSDKAFAQVPDLLVEDWTS